MIIDETITGEYNWVNLMYNILNSFSNI
jgi:hypothetical protein